MDSNTLKVFSTAPQSSAVDRESYIQNVIDVLVRDILHLLLHEGLREEVMIVFTVCLL